MEPVSGGASAVVLALAAGVVGLALGRVAPKRDPVGTLCGTCDGPTHVLWDVMPGLAPVRCPECGRTVAAPTAAIVGAVIICLGTLQALGEGTWTLVATGVLGCSLATLVWTDARHRLLPAQVVWPATAASLPPLAVAEIVSTDNHLMHAGVTAIASGGVFLVLHVVSPTGLAFGDVRLAVLLGLHLGWRSAAAAVWSFLLAASLGAAAGLVRKHATGDNTLPFGPFLAGATGVVLVLHKLVAG